jgi:hypothetical protein
VTIQPVAPRHLLTVAEYLEIGEIELGYSELVEGRLLMSPSPAFDHNNAALGWQSPFAPGCRGG